MPITGSGKILKRALRDQFSPSTPATAPLEIEAAAGKKDEAKSSLLDSAEDRTQLLLARLTVRTAEICNGLPIVELGVDSKGAGNEVSCILVLDCEDDVIQQVTRKFVILD